MAQLYGPPSDGSVIPHELEDAIAADLTDTSRPIGAAVAAVATTYVRDVRDYLAPGETLESGVDTTFTRELFQRGIDALAAEYEAQTGTFGKHGYQLFIPAGRWRLLSSLSWRAGVGLAGAGVTETWLEPVGQSIVMEGDNSYTVPPPYYPDCHFSDFSFDCADQVPATEEYDYTLKGFFARNLHRCSWTNVHGYNTCATMFGVDFLRDVRFTNCYGKKSGRDGVHEKFGTGAVFGVGTGMYEDESVTYTNCHAEDAGSSGFFFEYLAGRQEAQYYPRGVQLVGCSAKRCWQGMLDTGCRRIVATNCHFTDNHYAGWVVPKSGQSLHGGVDGVISDCVIVRNGWGDGVTTTGAGIYLRDVPGGYNIVNTEIAYNQGDGIVDTPTTPHGGRIRVAGCHIHHNEGSGIRFQSTSPLKNLTVEGNDIHDNGQDTTRTYRDGITILSPLRTPRITNNDLRNQDDDRLQQRGIALLGAPRTTSPRISGNTYQNLSGTVEVVQHTVADSTLITGNITTETEPVFSTTWADDFSRPDGPLVGEATPVGAQKWESPDANGAPVITDGRAGWAGATTGSVGTALVKTGLKDGTFQLTLASVGALRRGGVVFRGNEGGNYLAVKYRTTSTNHHYLIAKRIGGVETSIAETAVNSADGDVIRVEMAGTAVEVFVNEVSAWAGTITEQPGTGMGYYANSEAMDAWIDAASFTPAE